MTRVRPRTRSRHDEFAQFAVRSRPARSRRWRSVNSQNILRSRAGSSTTRVKFGRRSARRSTQCSPELGARACDDIAAIGITNQRETTC
jgi:hypothetical protein